MAFTRAQRKRVYLKIGVIGPSGSGKTYSALQLAFGLAGPEGRVAVIDTEQGSASLYADLGPYDVTEIGAPFTVARYQAAIREAATEGYDVLVIDSISHAWAGEGGLLSIKESLDARGGNSFANWAKVTPLQEQFKSAILQAPLHIIVTMRSKQDYVMGGDGDGKNRNAVVKVGTAPVQREGFEYELSTVFDVSMAHEALVSKDRTGLFDSLVGKLTKEHGARIRQWLESGAEPSVEPMEEDPAPVRAGTVGVLPGKTGAAARPLAGAPTANEPAAQARERTAPSNGNGNGHAHPAPDRRPQRLPQTPERTAAIKVGNAAIDAATGKTRMDFAKAARLAGYDIMSKGALDAGKIMDLYNQVMGRAEGDTSMPPPDQWTIAQDRLPAFGQAAAAEDDPPFDDMSEDNDPFSEIPDAEPRRVRPAANTGVPAHHSAAAGGL